MCALFSARQDVSVHFNAYHFFRWHYHDLDGHAVAQNAAIYTVISTSVFSQECKFGFDVVDFNVAVQ